MKEWNNPPEQKTTDRGLLIVLSGPSGTGKGTLCRELLAKIPGLKYSISATTRPPREGEIDGVHYFFISESDFQERLARGEFLEWATVYDNLYGTLRWQVEKVLAGGNDVILEIDIQGARQIKGKFPDGVFIFIVPPSLAELAARIERRGTDPEEVIRKRLHAAGSELLSISEYDYIVINDSIDQAVNKLTAIITAEKCRVNRRIYDFSQLTKEVSDGTALS
jgi:guanylate kinase